MSILRPPSPLDYYKMLECAEHVQAIGQILLAYNSLESVVYTYLTYYLPAPRKSQGTIFRSLHNRARVDLIKGLVDQKESDPKIRELIHHLLRALISARRTGTYWRIAALVA